MTFKKNAAKSTAPGVIGWPPPWAERAMILAFDPDETGNILLDCDARVSGDVLRQLIDAGRGIEIRGYRLWSEGPFPLGAIATDRGIFPAGVRS